MSSGFVEFHPSMSLENKPNLTSLLSQNASMESPMAPVKMENVLAQRSALWHQVDKIVEILEKEERNVKCVEELKQFKKLNAICRARELHMQTIKLGLMHERNEYLTKLIAIQRLLPESTESGFKSKIESILAKVKSKTN